MKDNEQSLGKSPGNEDESCALMNAAWFGVAVGAVALGLYVGREIRRRYKFNRRTPYDFYAHAGDDRDRAEVAEFGYGV